MVGAWRLLRRGLGLGTESRETERVVIAGAARTPWAEEGREPEAEFCRDGGRATGALTVYIISAMTTIMKGGNVHWNEVGGALLSLSALNAALLFNLGPTVGGLVLCTENVSLRLCPGTPSNVSLFSELAELTALTNFGGGLIPCLSAAAFVIRGAIAGAAVDATAIVVDRLCPGTSMNRCFS